MTNRLLNLFSLLVIFLHWIFIIIHKLIKKLTITIKKICHNTTHGLNAKTRQLATLISVDVSLCQPTL